ncbi:MAG: protein TolR [Alphaproteobacteria bacterium]|nr:protein TolR [Alphaproteobacteria bacterium]
MGASLSSKTRSRGRRTGGQYRPMAEINVTPMVDVMLVLLVIFMVAAPLLTAGVPIDLPNSKAKSIDTEDNKPIEITLDKDGKIFLGEKTEVKKVTLVTMLSPMLEGREDTRIYVRADKALDYGNVMSVLGLLNAAGFTRVALISEPE